MQHRVIDRHTVLVGYQLGIGKKEGTTLGQSRDADQQRPLSTALGEQGRTELASPIAHRLAAPQTRERVGLAPEMVAFVCNLNGLVKPGCAGQSLELVERLGLCGDSLELLDAVRPRLGLELGDAMGQLKSSDSARNERSTELRRIPGVGAC